MALYSDGEPGQKSPGFPVIFDEGMGNATVKSHESANVVAEPGTDTVFAMWNPPGGGARLVAYNLSTASEEWALDGDDLTAYAEPSNLLQVSDLRYHDGSLYVLAEFSQSDGRTEILDTRLLALSPENGSVEVAYDDSRWSANIAAIDDERIVAVDSPNKVGRGIVEIPVWNRTSGEQLRTLQYKRAIGDVVLVDDALFVRFEETDEVEVVHLPSGHNETASVMPGTSTEYAPAGQLYETPKGIHVASFERRYVRETNLTRSVVVGAAARPSAVVLDVAYVTGAPAGNATVTVGEVAKPVADNGTVRFSVDELRFANASSGEDERTVSVSVAGTEYTTTISVETTEEVVEPEGTPIPTGEGSTPAGAGGFGPLVALGATLLAAVLLRSRRR